MVLLGLGFKALLVGSWCIHGSVLPPWSAAGQPKLRRVMGGGVRRGVEGEGASRAGRHRAPRCGEDGGVIEKGVARPVRGVDSAGGSGHPFAAVRLQRLRRSTFCTTRGS